MKFYSIIFALLLTSVMATAQSATGITPAIAALTTNTTEKLPQLGAGDETETSQLILTTDKKINNVKVVDEAGDIVMSSAAQYGESVKFNLRKLQKGLYYIHIYCEGEKIVRKFLKK